MNQEDFQKIKADIKAYKDAKNIVLKRLEGLKQEIREGEKFPWVLDMAKDELYKDLFQSDERKKFNELAKKANTDPEFEKYFRAAHLEIFFGLIVNPNNIE